MKQHDDTATLTVKETAKLLGYSEVTIRRAISRGDLPVIRLGEEGGIRITKAALIRKYGSDIFLTRPAAGAI